MKKISYITIAIVLLFTLVGCTSEVKTNTEKPESAFGNMVKSNIDSKKGYVPEEAPSFLSEENQELFREADYIYFNFSVSAGFDLINYDNGEFKDIDENGTTYRYYKTDYDYTDFVNYIKSIFSEDVADSLINGSDSYKNIDGILYCLDAARGSDISYTGKSYKLISESSDEIDFSATAKHSWAEFYESEKQYRDEGNTDAYEWEEEYSFKMVKTEDGFRISEFEYWK